MQPLINKVIQITLCTLDLGRFSASCVTRDVLKLNVLNLKNKQ